MDSKRALLLALGIAFLFLAAGCVQQEQHQPEGWGNGTETVSVSFSYTDATGASIVERHFVVEKGTNAFEAMKANLEVGYEQFDFGAMVNSIEGISAPEDYYLALYVNGQYAEKGISDYTVEGEMAIEWKTEALQDFGLE